MKRRYLSIIALALVFGFAVIFSSCKSDEDADVDEAVNEMVEGLEDAVNELDEALEEVVEEADSTIEEAVEGVEEAVEEAVEENTEG